MTARVDLHSHSHFSDGVLSVEALCQQAERSGLDYLAISDHDTVDAHKHLQMSPYTGRLRIIPAVEISCQWRQMPLHILGLNINVDNMTLEKGLAQIQQLRLQRAKQIAATLETIGVKEPLQRAQTFAAGQGIGRVHFARVLIEQDYAKDIKGVFAHYLVRGKPGSVQITWPDLSDALAWIRAAGGEAVIAHPLRYSLSHRELDELMVDFTVQGGMGLEVATPLHSAKQRQFLAGLCEKYHCYASQGSDFHGLAKSKIRLGKTPALPSNCRPIWTRW